MYMVVTKGGSGWAKRRTKAGKEDEALAAANNEAERKERRSKG